MPPQGNYGWAGNRMHTSLLWATRQQTMEPKRIGIGRDEKGAEDISQTIRTIAAMRILRRMIYLDTSWRPGVARESFKNIEFETSVK